MPSKKKLSLLRENAYYYYTDAHNRESYKEVMLKMAEEAANKKAQLDKNLKKEREDSTKAHSMGQTVMKDNSKNPGKPGFWDSVLTTIAKADKFIDDLIPVDDWIDSMFGVKSPQDELRDKILDRGEKKSSNYQEYEYQQKLKQQDPIAYDTLKLKEKHEKEMNNFFNQNASSGEKAYMDAAEKGTLIKDDGTPISREEYLNQWWGADWWNDLLARRHAAQRDSWIGRFAIANELQNQIDAYDLNMDQTKQWNIDKPLFDAIQRFRKGGDRTTDTLNLLNANGLLDENSKLNEDKVLNFVNNYETNAAKMLQTKPLADALKQKAADESGLLGTLKGIMYSDDRLPEESEVYSFGTKPIKQPSIYHTLKKALEGVNDLMGEVQAPIFGDDITDATRDYLRQLHNLEGDNTPDGDVKRRNILYNMRSELDDRMKVYKQYYAIEDGNYKHFDEKISQKYKDESEKAQKESFFFEGNFWHKMKYGTGNTVGSSAADPNKTIANTLLGIATAFGGARAITAIPQFLTGQTAGAVENYAEVGNAYVDKLIKEFSKGLDYVTEKSKKAGINSMSDVLKNVYTDDIKKKELDISQDPVRQIVEYMMTGLLDINKALNNVELSKAFVNATNGLENLFNADMVATTADNVVDVITAGFSPIKSINAGKIIRSNKYGRFASMKYGDKFNLVTEGIGKGYDKLLVGGFATGAAGGIVGGVLYPFKDKISGFMAHEGADAAAKLSKILPKSAINAARRNSKSLKKLKDVTSTFLKRDISERIEEGKQQLNSEAFANGDYEIKYDSKNRKSSGVLSLSDHLFNDFMSGAESAKVAVGMYLGGLKWTSDEELYENIASVPFGGGSVFSILKPIKPTLGAVTDIMATEAIAHNMFIDKHAQRSNYLMSVALSKMASSSIMSNKYSKAFRDLEEYNKKAEEDGREKIPNELLEEQRKKFMQIRLLQESDRVNEGAKKQGIKKGSDLYHKYISEISTQMDLSNIAIQNMNNADDNIMTAIDSYVAKHIDSSTGELDSETASHANMLASIFDLKGSLSDAERYKRSLYLLNAIHHLSLLKNDLATGPITTETRKELMQELIQGDIEQALNFVKPEYKLLLLNDAQRFIIDNELSDNVMQDVRDKFYHGVDKIAADSAIEGITESPNTELEDGARNALSIVNWINEHEGLEREDENVQAKANKKGLRKRMSDLFGPFGFKKRLKKIEDAIGKDADFYLRMQDAYVDYKLYEEQKRRAEIAAKLAELISGEIDEETATDLTTPQEEDNNVVTAAQTLQPLAVIPQQPVQQLLLKPEISEKERKKNLKKIDKFSDELADAVQKNDTKRIETRKNALFNRLKRNGMSDKEADEYINNIIKNNTVKPKKKMYTTPSVAIKEAEKKAEAAPEKPSISPDDNNSKNIIEAISGAKNAIQELLDEDPDEQLKRAIEELKRGFNGQLNSGLPLNIILEKGSIVMIALIRKGYANIYQIANQMINYFGENIVDYIISMYNYVLDSGQVSDIDGITDKEELRGINTDAILNAYRASKESNTIDDDQEAKQRVRNKINALSKWTKEHVVREYTTGSHYFIRNDDGSLEIRQRVHNILSDSVEKGKEYTQTISKTISKLLKLDRDSLLDKLKNGSNPKLIGYYEYLLSNKDIPSQLYSQIIQGIANEMQPQEYNIFLSRGNAFDAINRMFFVSTKSANEFKSEFDNIKFFDNLGNELHLSDIMTRDAFEKYLEIAETRRNYYTQQLRWDLYTDQITLTATIEGINVAGEPDMLAVDKDGKIHIIDFKTTYKNYLDYTTIDPVTGKQITRNVFKENPGTTKDGRVWKMSQEQQYSLLLSTYSLMLKDASQEDVEDMHIYVGKYKDSYPSGDIIKQWENPGENGLIKINLNDNLSQLINDQKEIKNLLSLLYNKFRNILQLIDQLEQLYNIVADLLKNISDQNIIDSGVEIQNDIVFLSRNVVNAINFVANNNLSQYDNDVNSISELIKSYTLLQNAYNDLRNQAQSLAGKIATAPKPVLKVVPQRPNTVRDRGEAAKYNNMNWARGFDQDANKDDIDELGILSTDPNFVNDATFEVQISNPNDVRNSDIYVVVTYKGKTYPRCKLFLANGDQLVKDKLLSDIEKCINNGANRIAFNGIQRTYGLKCIKPSTSTHSVTEVSQLMQIFDDDIYNIEYVAGSSKVGIVKVNGNKSIISNPGGTITSYNNSTLSAGTVVIMINPVKNEDNAIILGTGYTPVPLKARRITPKEANLVIDILSGKHGPLNGNYQENLGELAIPIRNYDIISMFIPLSDSRSKYHGKISISQNNGVIYITNKEGSIPYRMDNSEEMNKLHELLVQQNVWPDLKLMQLRLGDRTTDNPFKLLSDYVRKSGETVRIGDSIEFSPEDFSNPNKKGDTLGLSYLGWMIKNETLGTNFERLEKPLVSFTGAEPLVDTNKDSLQITTEVMELQLKDPTTLLTVDDIEDLADFFGGDVYNMRQLEAGLLDAEKAKNWLKRVFGDNFDPKIIDDFIDESVTKDGRVVGRFAGDIMILSKKANQGVEYHEAFHRVVEVMIGRQKRQKLYDLYRKQHSDKVLSDRQVAEGLADDFMKFNLDIDNYNKILPRQIYKTFKYLKLAIKGLRHGNVTTFWTYVKLNSGGFKKGKPSKARINVFKKVYGWLDAKTNKFERNGVTFENVVDYTMYNKIIDFLVYMVINKQKIKVNDLHVENITLNYAEIKKYPYQQLLKLIRGKLKLPIYDTVDKAIEEMLSEKAFANTVLKDISSRISSMATHNTEYDIAEERENIFNDANTGDLQVYSHEDYEFSRFESTNKQVKFFFSIIPKLLLDKNTGKMIPKPNELGLPEYYPSKYAFSVALNVLHNCKTQEELLQKCAELGLTDYMFEIIHRQLSKLIQKNDADSIGLLNAIFNSIKCTKNSYNEVLQHYNPGSKQWELTLQPSNTDYSSSAYPRDWSANLYYGAGRFFTLKNGKIESKSVQIIKNGQTVTITGAKALHNELKYFNNPYGVPTTITDKNGNHIKINRFGLLNSLYGFINGDNRPSIIPYDGKIVVIDWNNPKHLEIAKDRFLNLLNSLGVQFSKDELNFTLIDKFGGNDAKAFYKFLRGQFEDGVESIDTIEPFFKKLNELLDVKTVNGQEIVTPYVDAFNDRLFLSIGFLKVLGNHKYAYAQSRTEVCTYAFGDKAYTMSQSTILHDISDLLNQVTYELDDNNNINWDTVSYPKEIEPLFKYAYCLMQDENDKNKMIGSIILKQVLNPKNKQQIKVQILLGNKAKLFDGSGVKYVQTSNQEDYANRCAILENGGLLLPVLSDKSTFYYISGILLPGLNYKNLIKSNQYEITLANGKIDINYGNDVLDQMIEYAETEFISAVDNCHIQLKDGQSIRNYDEQKNSGKRMIMCNKLYIDGKWVHFNVVDDNYKEALNRFKEVFYDKSIEEKRKIMNDTLKQSVEHEKNELVANKIIKYTDAGLIDPTNMLLNSKYIGNSQIGSGICGLISSSIKDADAVLIQQAAINMYIMDMSIKSIMSKLETERIMSGNPGFYKITYEETRKSLTSKLTKDRMKKLGVELLSKEEQDAISKKVEDYFKDRVEGAILNVKEDQSKRYGGLSSTGTVGNLHGLNTFYNCAEVANELVKSRQYEHIKEVVTYGQYRDIYDDLLKNEETAANEYTENPDTLSIDEIKSRLEKYNLLKVADSAAELVYTAYKSGIDVADGAAYISADMAERLLRAQGAWDNKIETAFKILKGEQKADIMSIDAAYQQVFTSVIGNQKYTAFGFRSQECDLVTEENDEFEQLSSFNRSKITRAVPYYNKMALFPIFDCIANGRMRDIYDKMKNQKVDMLMVNSAVKVGSQGSINGKETSETINFADPEFKFNIYEQPYLFLRKLLNTDPSEKENLAMGTQATKIALSNLKVDRTYLIRNNDGTTELISGSLVLKRIMKSINVMSEMGILKIANRFFNEDGTLNQKEFSLFLQEQLANRGASQELIKSVGTKTVKDEDGNDVEVMNLSLEATSSGSFIESILASVINKEVIEINSPGAPFIQRSIWGMDEIPVGFADNKFITQPIRLEMSILDGPAKGAMDCVLSMDYFVEYTHDGIPYFKLAGKHALLQKPLKKNGLIQYTYPTDEQGYPIFKIGNTVLTENDYDGIEPTGKKDKSGKAIVKPYKIERFRNASGNILEYHKYIEEALPVRKTVMRNMSFQEIRQWLIDNNIIGENASPNMMAYRIPTQAQSSIHALRCKDVLPVVRDTVILPEEFTRITGSDFDIDKLFISALNYNMKGDNVTNEFKDNDIKQNQNQLLNTYISLLLDINPETGESRNANVHHRSVDNDTSLPKDVLNQIEKHKTDNEQMPYLFGLIYEQTMLHDSFMAGKSGIAPFALNNNNHALTMLYGVSFKHIGFLYHLDHCELYKTQDDEGNSIMSWISAMINAHVDMAKDPWAARLNINNSTYNLTNLLIRLGFGKQGFYFQNTLIIKRLAEMENSLKSQYQADPTINIYTRRKEETAKILHTNLDDSHWSLALYILSAPEAIEEYDEIIANMFKEGIFQKHVLNPYENFVINDVEYTPQDIEMYAYVAYEKFRLYTQALSDLVLYSKIDTKKQGKSVIEQLKYLEGVKRVFGKNGSTYAMFESQGIDDMYEKSFLKTKTEGSISLYLDILGKQLLSAKSFVIDGICILAGVNSIDKVRPLVLKKYKNAIIAAIKSDFFNKYMRENNIDARGLFVDDFENHKYSMHTRVMNLKIMILSNPKYNYLLTNALLQQLIGSDKYDTTPKQTKDNSGNTRNKYLSEMRDKYDGSVFLRLFNGMEEDGVSQDQIMLAWDDLLHDDNEAIRKLARDLVVYAFLTSGDTAGYTKFFKFVPSSWRIDSGYSDFIDSILNSKYYSIDFEDIRLNNAFDNDFVPQVHLYNYYYNKAAADFGFPLVLVGRSSNKTDSDYIKVRSTEIGPDMNKNYILYKRVGYGKKGPSMFPIYVKINPKGVTYKNNIIIEYGRNDAEGVTVEYYDRDTKRIFERLLEDINSIDISKAQGLYKNMIATYNMGAQGNILEDFVEYIKYQNKLTGKLSILLSEVSTNNTSPEQFDIKNIFSVNPSQKADIKAVAKAKIATQFIGFADGIENSSTALYAQQAGEYANTGNYSSNDVIFVSVPGKRGDEKIRHEQLDKTINEAIKAIEAGATILCDNKSYTQNSQYNEGEHKLDEEFTKRGYSYSEILVDNHVIGVWKKQENIQRSNSINIYAGTGENADLSNFANRPFTINFLGQTFENVEQAFLYMKLAYAPDTEKNRAIKSALLLRGITGAKARELGRQIQNLDRLRWDTDSSEHMHDLILMSFELNPDATERLLSTGNATLTHIQDKGKWGKEFPRLLMEVRDELRNQQADSSTSLRDAKQVHAVINVLDYLKSKINGLTYLFITPERAKEILGDKYNDEINAFFYNGEVYLINGRFNDLIAVEECLHPLVNAIAKLNPDLIDSLFEEAIVKYPSLYSRISLAYGTDAKAEMVTQALSRIFAKDFKQGKQNKLVKLAQLFLRILSDLLGFSALKPTTTLQELSDLILNKDTKFNVDLTGLEFNRTPRRNEIQTFRTIISNIKSRISAERKRKITNDMKIARFTTMRDLFENVYTTLFGSDPNYIERANDPDAIDKMFEAIAGSGENTIAFLDMCGDELEQIVNYISSINLNQNPDALDLLTIQRDILGFYENVFPKLNEIFSDDPNNPYRNVQNILAFDDASQLFKRLFLLHAECKNRIDKMIDDYVKSYVDKYVDENVHAGNALIYKENMMHWLKNEIHTGRGGSIGRLENFGGNATTSTSPITRMMYHMINQSAGKINDKAIKKGSALVNMLNKIQGHGFRNYQRRFCETDKDGMTTGYFISEVNRGLFYKDLDKFKKDLFKKYEKNGLVEMIMVDGEERMLFHENKSKNLSAKEVEYGYFDLIDDWKDEHSNRKYKAEYYKQRRRILSKDTINVSQGIQSQIDAILSKCYDLELKVYIRSKLRPAERKLLDNLEERKKNLESFYIPIKDINGEVVDYVKKSGDELRIAEELSRWNYIKSKNLSYEASLTPAEFDELADDLKAKGYTDLLIQQFYTDNMVTNAIPLSWFDTFDSLFQSVPMSEEDDMEYKRIKREYNKIKNRIRFISGFSYLDLSKLTKADYNHLQDLDKLLSDIMSKYGKRHLALNVSKDDVLMHVQFIDHPHIDNGNVTNKTELWYLTLKYGSDWVRNNVMYENNEGEMVPVNILRFMLPLNVSTEKQVRGQFVKATEGEWLNKNFDETDKHTTQPKLSKYRNKKYDKLSKDDKTFLQLLISTMQEANDMYGFKHEENPLKMPQIPADATSLLFGSNIGFFNKIKYNFERTFVPDAIDEYSGKSVYPNGKEYGSVPVRFKLMLEHPENISTDLVGSVMMYYINALRYDTMTDSSNILELMQYIMESHTPDKYEYKSHVDRTRRLIDTEVYGIKIEGNSKTAQTLDKVGKWMATKTTLHLLAMNLNSIVKGWYDAAWSNLTYAVTGKYFNVSDMGFALKTQLKDFINTKWIRSVGKVRSKSLGMALDKRLGVTKTLSAQFMGTHQTFGTRLLKDWKMLPQEMVDYGSSTLVMLERLHNYRLVEIPETILKIDEDASVFGLLQNEYENTGSTKRMFVTKEQCIQLFRRAGYNKKDALTQYKRATCLYDAYELVDGFAEIKDEFKDYVNGELEGAVRSGIKDLTALINGVQPEGARSTALNRVPFLGAFFTTRGFMITQINDRSKHGSDFMLYHQNGPNSKFVERKRKDLRTDEEKEYYDEYVNAQYSFSLGKADLGMWIRPLRPISIALRNIGILAYNMISGNDKEMKKIFRNERERRNFILALMEIAGFLIPLAIMPIVGPALMSIATGSDDDDWETKLQRWIALRTLLLISAATQERSTFYNPETLGDMLNTPSTQYTWIKNYTYLLNSAIDLYQMIRYNCADFDDEGNALQSTDYLTRGSYKGQQRRLRNLFKTLNMFDIIPADNFYRSISLYGSAETFKFYNSRTSPSMWGWQPDSYDISTDDFSTKSSNRGSLVEW